MKKQLHFELSEFERRVAAVKKEMVRRGIDILLVAEPANQYYLTGYDAYSFYTPQIVIVALEHDEPIWIGRFLDRVSAAMTTYLAEDNIRAYSDEYVASTELSAYGFMAGIVKELGGEKAKIGVEMASFYYPARAHADFVRALPLADFVDVDVLVNWIRMIKSPAEISIMRQAGIIADAMIQRALDTIKPGVRECDVAAAVYHQQISGTPDFGGSYACVPPFLCVGERAIAPHASWTDEPISESTIVTLEVFGNRHRYQVNLARSISVGEPAASYRKLSEIVVEALNTGLENIRPGRTCSEVDSFFREALARHGYHKEARRGYPIGAGYPPTLQYRTASFRKEDKTVLQPGMCFHMHNGLWLDKVGISITQPIVVTESGYEALTSTPRTLFVK